MSAVHAALDAVSAQLLEDHTRGCVQHAIKSGGGEQAIGELMSIVRKLSR
jgi:DNA-binding FrmR family transcriptional regulator